MVVGRREAAEKARARWAKLKRFVKSGAYMDDLTTPISLLAVAQTIHRMDAKEKTMMANGDTLIDTARSETNGFHTVVHQEQDKIVEQLGKELVKRDIFTSQSVSRPKLVSSNKKHRPSNMVIDSISEYSCSDWENPNYEYEDGEEIKLADLKHQRKERRRLVKTEDFYYAACSFCRVSPVSNFLKQCSAYSIKLKNSFLSARDVKAICISLVRDHKIHTLDVSGNEIGALGVMYVGEMMVENNTIIELNLSGTIPGKAGLEALAESLKENKSLKVLRLEENKIQHTEMEFIIKIIENVPTLQELHLGHNALGFEGGNLLAKIIATNTTIKVLDLQWNQIRRNTAKSICKALGDNNTLWTLDLSWNGLGQEGCIELAKSLRKNTKLVDLDVSSNRIDMTSLRFLLHGLVQNRGLKYFKMGRNPITTEGAKAVIRGIQTSPVSKLEKIQLEDISVDEQFLELMAELHKTKGVRVTHGEQIAGSNAVTGKDHDPHDLNRFDPVMVLVEYMRIDNLRLIDFFQYLDTNSREKLSKSNFRDGVANLGIPLTEHHLDIVMERIDLKKDGYVDLEEFMTVHREVSRQITQRTTRAKSKQKEDEGLIGLRKILKEIIEKRNKTNKEKAQQKVFKAATERMMRSLSVSGSAMASRINAMNTSRPSSSALNNMATRFQTNLLKSPRENPPSSPRMRTSRPNTSSRRLSAGSGKGKVPTPRQSLSFKDSSTSSRVFVSPGIQ